MTKRTGVESYTDYELASHIFAYIVNQTFDTDDIAHKHHRNKAFLDGVGLFASDEQMAAAKQIICTEYEYSLDDPDIYGNHGQGEEAKLLLTEALRYF